MFTQTHLIDPSKTGQMSFCSEFLSNNNNHQNNTNMTVKHGGGSNTLWDVSQLQRMENILAAIKLSSLVEALSSLVEALP